MRNKIFFLGMTILILSLGLVFVGCKDDSDDSGGNTGGQTGGGGGPATNGRLTITGLSAYSGKYVMAITGTPVNLNAGEYKDYDIIPVIIPSSGSVTLKVWIVSGTTASDYSRNDQNVNLSVSIYNTASYQTAQIAGGNLTVNFTNGVGTGSFVPY